jgi:hypothetical protein
MFCYRIRTKFKIVVTSTDNVSVVISDNNICTQLNDPLFSVSAIGVNCVAIAVMHNIPCFHNKQPPKNFLIYADKHFMKPSNRFYYLLVFDGLKNVYPSKACVYYSLFPN